MSALHDNNLWTRLTVFEQALLTSRRITPPHNLIQCDKKINLSL